RRLGDHLGALELGFAPLALDELSDLAADALEEGEHGLVGPTRLGAEKLHHAQEATWPDDGKGERAVHATPGRRRRSRKIRIPHDVDDPRGATGGPPAAPQGAA